MLCQLFLDMNSNNIYAVDQTVIYDNKNLCLHHVSMAIWRGGGNTYIIGTCIESKRSRNNVLGNLTFCSVNVYDFQNILGGWMETLGN